MDKFYERHTYDIYADVNLPIIFHTCKRTVKKTESHHWHENVEILCFKQGTGEVSIDDNIVIAKQGDTVIVNSDELHSIKSVDGEVTYYCLIVDKNFCEQYGFLIDEQYISSLISDNRIYESISIIYKEFEKRGDFYIPAIMSEVMKILTILFRDYPKKSDSQSRSRKNIDMIKSGIRYIKKHFAEQISVEDIANYAGYSKYYFCRCFKEITGDTVNSYINNVRIDHAKKLLSSKGTSVSQAAVECGFSDISYFTKIFKKYTSTLPSEVKVNSDI